MSSTEFDLRLPGEDSLQCALRVSGLELTMLQHKAVVQLFLHHSSVKSISGVVEIVKAVHKKEDSFWKRTDLTLGLVLEECFGDRSVYDNLR